jgi:acyl carrier protein
MLQGRLVALVEHILAKNAIDRSPALDVRLSEAGLSSLDMVNLMFAIEAEFDVVIAPGDITPENFYSIATIEALLARMGAGGAA